MVLHTMRPNHCKDLDLTSSNNLHHLALQQEIKFLIPLMYIYAILVDKFFYLD